MLWIEGGGGGAAALAAMRIGRGIIIQRLQHAHVVSVQVPRRIAQSEAAAARHHPTRVHEELAGILKAAVRRNRIGREVAEEEYEGGGHH